MDAANKNLVLLPQRPKCAKFFSLRLGGYSIG